MTLRSAEPIEDSRVKPTPIDTTQARMRTNVSSKSKPPTKSSSIQRDAPPMTEIPKASSPPSSTANGDARNFVVAEAAYANSTMTAAKLPRLSQQFAQ